MNAGTFAHGYNFHYRGSLDSTYCKIEPFYGVGGISTEAGGNVTITAGGDVTSYLPGGSSDHWRGRGSGAFGPQAGNVTIVAGGNVTGHYVEANGTAPSTPVWEIKQRHSPWQPGAKTAILFWPWVPRAAPELKR